MYSSSDIFLVKHFQCHDCGQVEFNMYEKLDIPVGIKAVTIGATPDEDPLVRLAKRINGVWIQECGMIAGFPCFIVKEKYVIPRGTSKLVAHADLQRVINIAEDLWQDFPEFFDLGEELYDVLKASQGKYYELRKEIFTTMGSEGFLELSSLCQLRLLHNWTANDEPYVRRMIELIMATFIRKVHNHKKRSRKK